MPYFLDSQGEASKCIILEVYVIVIIFLPPPPQVLVHARLSSFLGYLPS